MYTSNSILSLFKKLVFVEHTMIESQPWLPLLHTKPGDIYSLGFFIFMYYVTEKTCQYNIRYITKEKH